MSLLPAAYLMQQGISFFLFGAHETTERNLTILVSHLSFSPHESNAYQMYNIRPLTAACNTVLFFLVYTSSLRLVGVQMQHCHYDPAIPSNVMWGGALFANYDATIVIESSTFVNNSAATPWKAPKRIFCGGAVWTEGPSAFIKVNFSGNSPTNFRKHVLCACKKTRMCAPSSHRPWWTYL